MTEQLDAVTAAIYKARWVDAFGRDGVIATDRVLGLAALEAAHGTECERAKTLVSKRTATLARLRAALTLLGHEDITPAGRRVLDRILDEVEAGTI